MLNSCRGGLTTVGRICRQGRFYVRQNFIKITSASCHLQLCVLLFRFIWKKIVRALLDAFNCYKQRRNAVYQCIWPKMYSKMFFARYKYLHWAVLIHCIILTLYTVVFFVLIVSDRSVDQKFSKWCSNTALDILLVSWQAFCTPFVSPGGPQLNTPILLTCKVICRRFYSSKLANRQK